MPRLSRERSVAARIGGCADLLDVRLFGVGANLETPEIDGSLSYRLSSDVSYQTLGDPIGTVIVTGEYVVKVLDTPDADEDATATSDDHEESEGDEPAKVAEVQFTLAALFGVAQPEDEPFTDEEYEAFAATTGQFALYPYAREFIADITTRMGLPALHIGTLRIELESRSGE